MKGNMSQYPYTRKGLFLWLLFCTSSTPVIAEKPIPGVVSDPDSRPGLRVPLHLEDEFGAARSDEPVTTGLPFPSGSLSDVKHVRILDPSGKEIPSQRRTLALWKDGSVKWLQVDFQAQVYLAGKAAYELEFGPEVRAGKVTGGLRVRSQQGRIQVDTGPARFSFRKDRFELFEKFAVDQNRNGWFGGGEKVVGAKAGGDAFIDLEHQAPGPAQEENWLLDAAGSPREVFSAANSVDKFSIEVEEQGPLRAVILMRGEHRSPSGRNFAPFMLRITAYAGKPFVRLSHFFFYNGQPKTDFIRAMGLRFPLSLEGKLTGSFGAEENTRLEMHPQAEAASLTEVVKDRFYHLVPWTRDRTVRYRLEQETNNPDIPLPVQEGKEAAGWVQLDGDRSGAFLALRDFWQLHPKELRIDKSAPSVTVYLWPERAGKVLDLRRRYDYVENEKHYDLSMFEFGGQGVGKTHEILFAAGSPESLRAETKSMMAFLNRPLAAYVTPEWYRESGAMLDYALRDRKTAPRREAIIDLIFEWLLRNPVKFHWDGMIDYGDTLFHGLETPTHAGEHADNAWGSRGYVGWLQNDGNLAHALWFHYLRTGDRRILRRAESMTRHIMDVDTCHWCENESYIGGVHRHDQQHWGNGVRGYGTDIHAMAEMYYLTGDRRALDTIYEFARFHMKGESTEDENMVGCLARAYEATGRQEYLDAAREAGKTYHYGFHLGKSGSLDQPHFRTAADLVHGFRFYENITGDGIVPDLFHKAAQKMAEGIPSNGYMLPVLSAAYLYDNDPLTLQTLRFCLGSYNPYGENLFNTFDPAKEMPEGAAALSWEQLVSLSKRTHFFNNNYSNTISLQTFPMLIEAGRRAGVPESDLPTKGYRLTRMGIGSDWGYAGEKVEPLKETHFVHVNLEAAANRNPLADPFLTTPDSSAGKLKPGDIGFDFGEFHGNSRSSFGKTQPGCIPVRHGMKYPYQESLPGPREHDNATFYGLPFGTTSTFCGVPFQLPDPLKQERGSIFVGKGESARIDIPDGTMRLHLLGHICLRGGILPEPGAEYILHFKDGTQEHIPLTKLEDYEWFTGWGFCNRARLARQWKASGSWDGGDGILLNLFTIHVEKDGLQSVTLHDTGQSHGLILLAATAEVKGAKQETPLIDLKPSAAAGLPSLAANCKYAEPLKAGWVGDASGVKSISTSVVSGIDASYRMDLPDGSYDLELELAGIGNGSPMFALSADGRLLCRKFALPTLGIGGGDPFETLRVPLQVVGGHTILKLERDRHAGSYRHYAFVRGGEWRLRRLAVFPRTETDMPAPQIRFGWVESDLDWKMPNLLPKVTGDFLETDAIRCWGSSKGTFRADLPDGTYELEAIFSEVGPMNVSLQGDEWLKEFSASETVRKQTRVTIKGQPLLLQFERSGEEGSWGISGLVLRPMVNP